MSLIEVNYQGITIIVLSCLLFMLMSKQLHIGINSIAGIYSGANELVRFDDVGAS